MKAINDETMQRLLATSFRNFHAKGLDYVCLRRSPDLTLKIYFFDAEAAGRQVVHPHDHRYDFSSSVIRGRATNTIYREGDRNAPGARRYDRFRFYTPLNDGSGFAEDGVGWLAVDNANQYGPGQTYRSLHATIHTLDDVQEGTILAIEQYADQVPLRAPTHTYMPINSVPKPPSLDGLYDQFTADALVARLQQLETVSPGALSWLQG